MNVLKTLLWTAIVPGSLTVLLPYWLISMEPGSLHIDLSGFRFWGLVPVIAGVFLYGWCAWDFAVKGRGTPAPFDPPRHLIIRGPYRFVRNPMYIAVVLVLLGEALLFGSVTLLVVAMGSIPLLHLWVVSYEEPTLKRKFGVAYERYHETVPRWTPRRPHSGS